MDNQSNAKGIKELHHNDDFKQTHDAAHCGMSPSLMPKESRNIKIKMTTVITSKNIKSGILTSVAFTGTPKKSTVTFATPYPDTNYTVTADCETVSGNGFLIQIESTAAGSFVINLGANNISTLSRVFWQTIYKGE